MQQPVTVSMRNQLSIMGTIHKTNKSQAHRFPRIHQFPHSNCRNSLKISCTSYCTNRNIEFDPLCHASVPAGWMSGRSGALAGSGGGGTEETTPQLFGDRFPSQGYHQLGWSSHVAGVVGQGWPEANAHTFCRSRKAITAASIARATESRATT